MDEQMLMPGMEGPGAPMSPPMPGDGAPPMPGAGAPPMPGAGAPPMPGAAMSDEDMRNELRTSMADLKNKRSALNADSFINKNKLDEAKAKMIRSVFQILTDVGVDPTDLESVQNFISQLEESDPDLLQLFNIAFDALESASTGMPQSDDGELPMVDGKLPIGADMAKPKLPLPEPPSDDMNSMPQAPAASLDEQTLGAKYNNIADAVNKDAV